MRFETKDIGNGNVTDVDTGTRVVTLYAAAFNNVDSYGDTIINGAFTKTIAEGTARIKHLRDHDTSLLIGKPLEMSQDSIGLLVKSQVSDTALGRDTIKLIQDGVLTENSIGYSVIKSQNDDAAGTRTLQELKLYEYSSVTWGANEKTPNLSVKSDKPLDKVNKLLTEFKKIKSAFRAGNFHDDTYALLEIKLAQYEAQIEDLINTSLELKEPELITTPELITEPDKVETEMKALADFYSAFNKIK